LARVWYSQVQSRQLHPNDRRDESGSQHAVRDPFAKAGFRGILVGGMQWISIPGDSGKKVHILFRDHLAHVRAGTDFQHGFSHTFLEWSAFKDRTPYDAACAGMTFIKTSSCSWCSW
jgi:hypothetical protein